MKETGRANQRKFWLHALRDVPLQVLLKLKNMFLRQGYAKWDNTTLRSNFV